MSERAKVRCIQGRHPLMDSTGAIVELMGQDPVAVLARLAHSRAYTEWPSEPIVRRHQQGVSIALPSPPDLVESAADLLEWAADDRSLDSLSRIPERIQRNQDLALRALLHAYPDAAFAGDGLMTVGTGRYSRSWSLKGPLPRVGSFGPVGRVPAVLVTGTNGKTTTTRLLAHLVRSAGLVPGAATSGGVVVGDEKVEPGDWTGPGGARRVLRDPKVDVAVLETARGGILRRGLALGGHDVAVLTNVTQDHLGEWGIDTVEQMAAAKLVIADALRPGGTLVVPAVSPPIWSVLNGLLSRRPDIRVRRFSSSQPADAWANDRYLIHGEAHIPIGEVPITISGTARHNVENALAAMLGALALGLPGSAINEGLRTFQPSTNDNPGRMNRFRLPSGAIVVLDVAHTPDGMRRIIETVRRWPQTRRTLLFGQTGDRPDSDIRDLTVEAASLNARIILKEMPTKLFDRRLGEVSLLAGSTLRALGYPESLLLGPTPNEEAGVRVAIQGLGSQDVAVLLIHESLVAAVDALKEAGAVAMDG